MWVSVLLALRIRRCFRVHSVLDISWPEMMLHSFTGEHELVCDSKSLPEAHSWSQVGDNLSRSSAQTCPWFVAPGYWSAEFRVKA